MQTANEEVINHVRANIAFEQMVAAVLYGAFACGGVRLVLAVLSVLVGGASFLGILDAVIDTLLYAFLIFLVGFSAAVVIAIPLFLTLEKRRYRKPWPYLIAAIIVELVFFFVVQGDIAVLIDAPLAHAIAWLAPAPVIAVLFGRFMKPLWRQAERSDSPAENSVIIRLD
ncbi:MAG: hypothetical protein ACE5FO_09240 [Parvularculaceae bacterium]